MSVLRVTPSELRAAERALATAATGISDELERLRDAADVLRMSWEGEAQASFDRSQTRLRSRMELHSARLTDIAKKVGELAENYGKADRDAARGLGGQ